MSEGNGSTKKTAYLGMPAAGGLTSGAAKGFFRPSRNLGVSLNLREGSLLAMNFNLLWCWALNALPRRPDYFAMQHSDIEPEDWWLDKLVDELEARNLDVLGVVAPIKDPMGLTSTAMARPDGDTWRVHGRLTMTEIYQLPETFTSEDLGYPLLLNTGLWVCRMGDAEWCPKVHFTINDRIAYSQPMGKYVPQCEPEDWYFSRLLHEQGLKVGCTRKVQIGHRGPVVFGNAEPWGRYAYDEAYLPCSVIEKQVSEGVNESEPAAPEPATVQN